MGGGCSDRAFRALGIDSSTLCLTLSPRCHLQALRSFKLSVTVDPKYHPKIIGRKGAVITQIRLEHDVNIQFPDKDDGNQVRKTLVWDRVSGPLWTCVFTWDVGPAGRGEQGLEWQVSED